MIWYVCHSILEMVGPVFGSLEARRGALLTDWWDMQAWYEVYVSTRTQTNLAVINPPLWAPGKVYCVDFDGVKIASGSKDATVKLWNPDTGQCLCTFNEHMNRWVVRAEAMCDARLIPWYCLFDRVTSLYMDDSTLISASADWTVIIHDFSGPEEEKSIHDLTPTDKLRFPVLELPLAEDHKANSAGPPIMAEKRRTLVLLVATGSFSPVHYGHLEMLNEAKRALERDTNVVVVGGYLSPVSDR